MPQARVPDAALIEMDDRVVEIFGAGPQWPAAVASMCATSSSEFAGIGAAAGIGDEGQAGIRLAAASTLIQRGTLVSKRKAWAEPFNAHLAAQELAELQSDASSARR